MPLALLTLVEMAINGHIPKMDARAMLNGSKEAMKISIKTVMLTMLLFSLYSS
jgi:hypothetical protein